MYAAPRGSIEPIFRGQGQEACLTEQVASATSLFMITNRDRLFSARSTEALSLLPPSSELKGDRTPPSLARTLLVVVVLIALGVLWIMASSRRSPPLKDWERADKLNIELVGYGWYASEAATNFPLSG